MNIIIQHQKLLNAVRMVERIVSKNTSLPVLQSILLKTDGGSLYVTATNLEIGIKAWVGAKIESSGVVAVPARVFTEFLTSIKEEKIQLKTEKNTLFLTTNNYKTQILCIAPEEFPLIPTIKDGIQYLLTSNNLKSILLSVIDATSLLETRPEFTGVAFTIEPNSIATAATDSFRLSEKILAVKTGVQKSFILPRATAFEIIRLTSDRSDDIQIIVSENQIAFRGSDFELVSRLIEGKYPDYKKIIPERFIAQVEINKQAFEQNIRTASVFSSTISDLHLHINGDKLMINAKNTNKGEIDTTIPLANNKAVFEISVNYRYLLDGLKILSGDTVVLGYTGPGSPVVLRGSDDTSTTYVIMPLRV